MSEADHASPDSLAAPLLGASHEVDEGRFGETDGEHSTTWTPQVHTNYARRLPSAVDPDLHRSVCMLTGCLQTPKVATEAPSSSFSNAVAGFAAGGAVCKPSGVLAICHVSRG